ncbi:MAG: HAD-IA family hydrolase [Synechococcales cyanobacterium CRU_2_2]|nr:HAD-IA family hydrolase [Synechococcales cyanobacterium CRU_2_2]
MSLLQAIIFDVDGTLADNERDGHRIAFNQTFSAAGLDWIWSERDYGKLVEIGGGKERIRHYMATRDMTIRDIAMRGKTESQSKSKETLEEILKEQEQADLRVKISDRFGDPARTEELELDTWVQQLHGVKMNLYQQLIAERRIPLRPGVLRLLQECRQAGVRLAIATTSALPSALALIETIAPDAPDWFEVIAAGDIVPAKKPSPEIYQYALQQLQLPASVCWAIEDSEVGARAAIAAGLPTLITVNDYTRQADFSGATLVLSDLGERDRPIQVLGGTAAGQVKDGSWVDLALLRRILWSSAAPN